MKHISEDELVAYACGDTPREASDAMESHLNECLLCRESVKETRLILEQLESLPVASAPIFAWSRLKTRVEATRPAPAWEELRWLRLTFAHLGAVLLAFALIVVAGSWLSSSELWISVGRLRAARLLGPNGVSALCFFGAGAILALALTPVLWWDSRYAGKNSPRFK